MRNTPTNRLLDRRPGRADRGAVLSRRLRRHPGRRAGHQPDLGPRCRGVGLHGRQLQPGPQTVRRQARAAEQGRRAAMRWKSNGLRRIPSSPTRPVRIRAREPDLQGRGLGRMPHARRSRNGQGILFRSEQPTTGEALSLGWLPGSESGGFNWGFAGSSNAPGEPCVRRPVQVGVRRRLELARVRFRPGHAQGRRAAGAGGERR